MKLIPALYLDWMCVIRMARYSCSMKSEMQGVFTLA